MEYVVGAEAAFVLIVLMNGRGSAYFGSMIMLFLNLSLLQLLLVTKFVLPLIRGSEQWSDDVVYFGGFVVSLILCLVYSWIWAITDKLSRWIILHIFRWPNTYDKRADVA